jgi:hypothetical protein
MHFALVVGSFIILNFFPFGEPLIWMDFVLSFLQ